MSSLATSPRVPMWRHGLAGAWIVALYLYCNPYRGVRHDAVLYFAQLQLHLTPSWLQGDLFFLGNSQDHYSLFSTIFAPVLNALGLSSSEIVILLVLHALFLLATWRLTAGLPAASRWCALGLALVLPRFYAPNQRFAFAEPFLTARTLAEPFAILALAWLLRGRLGWAFAAGACATLAHPLIALPAWLIAWRLLCARDRRWNWAALLALPVACLAWLHVAPFGGLVQRYDAEWLATVKLANSFVFVTKWQIGAWEQALFDGGLLWLCSRDASAPLSGLARATLVVAAACLAVSALGVDLLHDVLLTQMQLWRALWLVHLVATLSLAPLLLGLWRQGGKGRLAVFAVLLGAITVGSTVHTGWVAGLTAFAAVALANSRFAVSPAMLRIGIAACVLAALLVSGLVAMSQLDQLTRLQETGILIGRASAVPGTLGGVMLVVALGGLWPLVRPGRVAAACSAAGAVALLAIGVTQWDQRSQWSRYVEQHQGQPHPFQALIPVGKTVYWPDELLASWALLGRSSFYNVMQMSGSLFSRETSVVGIARWNAVGPLVIQSRLCRSIVASGLTDTKLEDCKPTLVAVRDVCHLSNVHPDFIVLDSAIEVPPLASWSHPTTDGSEPAGHFLYACGAIH